MNNEQITKFEKDNTYQRILASHLDDSFELTTAEETIKTRLRHIFGLRLNNKLSRHQAIQMQMREMGVSHKPLPIGITNGQCRFMVNLIKPTAMPNE
ncbi:hypothetical protein CAPN004_09070 [Capnocytophaga cynodegmi]|uniref:hypothetical protein n=1 Tax=Capnocytophaga cynodegmi TaxID=28189 RepID=UPI001AC03792|nr:hypothetical protein [Capnocytophaga cynodegmi]GIM51877.1 hypothetical protein CAPN004_09070 [Capnocytophaga cynodegmi]